MNLVPPAIAHLRDVVEDDAGGVEQDYNYLTYSFGDPVAVIARAYLDDMALVSIMREGDVPQEVLIYLKDRFDGIDQLTQRGYVPIWRRDDA